MDALIDHWVTIAILLCPPRISCCGKCGFRWRRESFALVTCVIRSASAAELCVSATVESCSCCLLRYIRERPYRAMTFLL